MQSGSALLIDSGSGAACGGFGSPAERDVEAVVNDVRQGNVSAGEAAKTYGAAFELVPPPFTVVGAASTITSDQGDDPA